jgi:anti-sigma B factor antagonist
MPLSLQSHRVGDITVVTCSGRIVEGPESTALQQCLDLLSHDPCVVLNLADVNFIDSSGLGLLVRLLARSRAAGGSLRLCAVPTRIGDVLKITRLERLFDTHASEADAVAAFYERGSSTPASRRVGTEILCVGRSADVQAYVRELLGHAGYGVLTVRNLSDALTLLKATRPRVVVIGADMCVTGGIRAVDTFKSIDATLSTIELPADFSGDDAGEAAERLLDQIRTIMSDREGPSTVPA